MIKAKVLRPFTTNGNTIEAGSIIKIPEGALLSLGDLVEKIPNSLTDADRDRQRLSADWRWFCDSHERSLADGHCQIKHDRLDPMTNCVGWQIKNGKALH